jgi:acetylornithine deacetylase/succinyl-diaminopimelate desuccinylase-like protein
MHPLYHKAVDLLQELISTPSFSKEEDKTAILIKKFLQSEGATPQRFLNNIWAVNNHYNPILPTILLNSHHDTVKPNPAYTKDPFQPTLSNGKLFGLGSNDAGGPLVSLIATFLHFNKQENLPFNIVIAATAEEEISGKNGIEAIWDKLPKIDFAIVGEPTLMKMAVAEKGLMVLDCVALGKAGHAAREEGVNALYIALDDINWFRNYRFEKVSETLGPVKMSATVINAGQAHNQVPPECHFTVDVRATDTYTLEEILETIKTNVKSDITPRSLRLRPKGIAKNHPLAMAATKLNIDTYGSPTTSDQALIPAPSIKMGPGDSARSHSADEFIHLREVEEGIDGYIRLINSVAGSWLPVTR